MRTRVVRLFSTLATRAERGVSLFEVLVTSAIIATLALIIGSNLPAARSQAQVSACESNIRTIATAAEQFYSAAGKYPQGGPEDVTVALFTTNTVAYLGTAPTDPASAGGTGAYSYQDNAAANGQAEYYVITCPGVHPISALSQLPNGAAATTGKIELDSRANLSAL